MFGAVHTLLHLLHLSLYLFRNIQFAFAFPNSQSMSNKGMSANTVDQKTIEKYITILGFGSLLSERSSRTTFPDLLNFRLGRVKNYRRVFGHPASIFFQRGIANLDTKEISSLSTEYVDGHPGFICSIFEVPNDDMMADGVPSPSFLEREEEFDIIEVPYIDFQKTEGEGESSKTGILCAAGTNDLYVTRWGEGRFESNYKKIWSRQNMGLGERFRFATLCCLSSSLLSRRQIYG